MPLEIKCTCAGCNRPQTVIVATDDKEQVSCPACNAPMLETRSVPGYLYILTNPSMPGLVKIGITTRSVADRASELNAATGVPAKFNIEAYFESSDPRLHESSVHRSLARVRIKGKEFFRVGLADAINAVRKVTGTPPLEGGAVIYDDPRAVVKGWMDKPKWP
jgi:hypothetical protein